jgi:hypothetical protein
MNTDQNDAELPRLGVVANSERSGVNGQERRDLTAHPYSKRRVWWLGGDPCKARMLKRGGGSRYFCLVQIARLTRLLQLTFVICDGVGKTKSLNCKYDEILSYLSATSRLFFLTQSFPRKQRHLFRW